MAIIIYNDAEHTYTTETGLRLPSVTQVLRAAGLATDYSAIDPAVLERARQRGNAVHEITHRLDSGEAPDPFIDTTLRPYQDAYALFREETQYESIASEYTLRHPELLYAGRVDAVGWLNGQRIVLDRKSTAIVDHVPTAPQTAAYRLAWEAMRPEEPVALIGALHLRRDGLYRLHLYEVDDATRIWRYALEIFQYKRKHRKTR